MRGALRQADWNPFRVSGLFYTMIPRLSLCSNRWAEISERLGAYFQTEAVPNGKLIIASRLRELCKVARPSATHPCVLKPDCAQPQIIPGQHPMPRAESRRRPCNVNRKAL